MVMLTFNLLKLDFIKLSKRLYYNSTNADSVAIILCALVADELDIVPWKLVEDQGREEVTKMFITSIGIKVYISDRSNDE